MGNLQGEFILVDVEFLNYVINKHEMIYNMSTLPSLKACTI